jgi:hypothetical protein
MSAGDKRCKAFAQGNGAYPDEQKEQGKRR